METIQMELVGNEVAITFRPEVGEMMSCRIGMENVAELGCLMLRAGNLPYAVNIAVPGMTLQVEGGSARRAWLGINRNSAPDLIACMKGKEVREIGHRLHDHYLRAKGASFVEPERAIYVRPVSYYYLDDEQGDVAATSK